ncbi:bacterial Ig-like domain-containing protein (plasmid) [Lactococcus lactis subsp. lactis]|uniref:bacterial Ig-like domain-containing protein n=1 Tax=Lactococcus lactis TaxID=1358 RepID=UPI00264757C3|nr:bacterial Ig-like domain-containing protein [Lactococcus lactis]WKB49861.1 bacterial Ig-like domain-containing protein [Lactococcus lactis subsp. lactis]
MKINKFASASLAVLLLSSNLTLLSTVKASATTSTPSGSHIPLLVAASNPADIASGTFGTSAWRIDASGTLHIGAGTLADTTGVNPWAAHSADITKISFDGKVIAAANSPKLFAGLNQLTTFENMSNFDTSNVTSMAGIFNGDTALTSLDLSHFDTSNVTTMSNMFNGDTALTSLDLSHFDTSNVTIMINMFNNNTALTSLDLSHFDTSNVTSMINMFNGDTALTSLDLSHFDTSNVADISKLADMFAGTTALSTITLGQKFVVSSTVALPTPPSTAPYIGQWKNGNHHFADLMTNYDGSTMSGTWTWAQDATDLTLKNASPTVTVGQTWDAKANIKEVKDQFGQTVNVSQVTINGTVDTTKPGTSTVTYTYGGKTQTATVTVVLDQTDLKVKNTTIHVGDTWNKANNFVSAKDKIGQAVNVNQVTVTGTVDTTKPGTSTVTYTYGGKTQTATVTVVLDQTDLKVKNTTIHVGDTWNKANNFVSAKDKAGQTVNINQVTVTGTVNTTKPGTSTITYSYGGKTAKAVVTVKAKSNNNNNNNSKPVAKQTLAVYRLYNKNSGEHFYTTSAFEKDSLVKGGWNYEGIGWTSPTQGTAVYRVYNPNVKGGDHYYTASQFEAQSLVKTGWKWDNGGKPVFYSGGKTPVYVAFNPNATASGSHNYTSHSFEQNSLLKNGWKFGKVQFYGK